jgi:hypothetical protein
VPAGSFHADLRAVVRGRNFRRLFATRLVSQAGDGAFQAALATLVFFSAERATTAAAAASAFAIAILPYTVIGPFAGVVLDRWRRRQILLVANLVRTVLVLVVAALVARGDVGVALSVLVLGCLSVNRFFLAGLGASLPHVVPRDELVMANAVAPTSGTVAALLGAATAYGARRALGPGDHSDAVVLLVAAAAYLGSALLTLRMERDLLGPEGRPGPGRTVRGELVAVGAGMVAGARHVRERPPAIHALAVIGVHRLAFGLVTVATILVCRYRLSDPADAEQGLVVVASTVLAGGLGFGSAALLTPMATRRMVLGWWIVICSSLAALAQAGVVAVLNLPVVLAGAFLIGVGVQSTKICVDAILQSTSQDAFRGRVFAFYDVIYNAGFVASAAVAALVLPPDGYSPPALLATCLLYAAAAVGYARVTWTRRLPSSRPVTDTPHSGPFG